MRVILTILTTSLLAACATPGDRAARMEREVAEMVKTYGPACEKLGYKADSDPWRDCILQLNGQESQRRAAPTCFRSYGFLQCL